jgi:hypothetical protein
VQNGEELTEVDGQPFKEVIIATINEGKVSGLFLMADKKLRFVSNGELLSLDILPDENFYNLKIINGKIYGSLRHHSEVNGRIFSRDNALLIADNKAISSYYDSTIAEIPILQFTDNGIMQL